MICGAPAALCTKEMQSPLSTDLPTKFLCVSEAKEDVLEVDDAEWPARLEGLVAAESAAPKALL